MVEDKNSKKTLRAVESLISEDRVLNFSDGVFAFASTLLVLKIDLPGITSGELATQQLTEQIINLWPQYFANIISFLMIGYYWLTHHAIFSLIEKFNQKIIWLNIIFLIFLSFLPFPVDLFGDYNNSEVVVAFYSLALALSGFLLALIWIYSCWAGLIEDLSKKHILYYSSRFLIAPFVFTISIPLAFIDPMLAKISWAFVIIGSVCINLLFKYKSPSIIEKESI